MPKYPSVTTNVYDTTCHYEEGLEVYVYNGQFTTNPGPPTPHNVLKPIANEHVGHACGLLVYVSDAAKWIEVF